MYGQIHIILQWQAIAAKIQHVNVLHSWYAFTPVDFGHRQISIFFGVHFRSPHCGKRTQKGGVTCTGGREDQLCLMGPCQGSRRSDEVGGGQKPEHRLAEWATTTHSCHYSCASTGRQQQVNATTVSRPDKAGTAAGTHVHSVTLSRSHDRGLAQPFGYQHRIPLGHRRIPQPYPAPSSRGKDRRHRN